MSRDDYEEEGKEFEHPLENSDQRVRKRPTKYDDRLSSFVRHFIDANEGFGHLALSPKTWEPPRGIRPVYSRVKPEHLKYMERKRNSKRKGGR